jgi:SAM-dependent methyltransferase
MSERHEAFCRAYPHVHAQVLPHFPLFDYRKPAGDPRVVLDYSNPGNQVGHQQRAHSVWWAIEKGGPTDQGLDIGSGKGLTPFACHVDLYGTGEIHPQERYSGHDARNRPAPSPYFSDIAWEGTEIDKLVPKGSVPFIVSNHSLEHMPPARSDAGIVQVIQRWMDLLRPGGVLAMVIPDNDFHDVLSMDQDHKNAWGGSDFERRILAPVIGGGKARVVEFNTFSNRFSFDVVLERVS